MPTQVLLALLKDFAVGTGAQPRESTATVGQRWGSCTPVEGLRLALLAECDAFDALAAQARAEVPGIVGDPLA